MLRAPVRPTTLSWIYLLLAGLLEVCWAVGMKLSKGFSRPIPSLLTAVALVGSLVLLAAAERSVPIGTAYAVWVGIGALGVATVGALFLGETLTPLRAGCLVLLVVAIAGLKIVP
jgi:quaternary ammonium compound-resistance protein SugE